MDESKKRRSNPNGNASKKKEKKSKIIEYVLVFGIILAILILAYLLFSNFLITPFSTFLSNFKSAPRIAVVVSFQNESQYISEYPCFTKLVGSIAYTRNATTIDFFILNATNCTYPVYGLGRPTQVGTTTRAKCLSIARSEPSIFLNYSSVNRTIITPYHLYVYGNAAYMLACPIAAEFT
ncbi:MAG: hypothetical protein ACP5P2_02715 [Candidatus Micrarchaeia archaeon]|jgi:hypothetical protein